MSIEPDGIGYFPDGCLDSPDLRGAIPILESRRYLSKAISLLPNVGDPCIEGVIYLTPEAVPLGYSEFVVCVQSHNRTIYAPQDTPALFEFVRVNSDSLPWIPNERVYIGWKRVYSGITYEVILEHLTQDAWVPTLTLGVLWRIPSSGSWQPGVWYDVNQEVTYEGHTYKCLQAHTSQSGWEPPNVPALWEFIS